MQTHKYTHGTLNITENTGGEREAHWSKWCVYSPVGLMAAIELCVCERMHSCLCVPLYVQYDYVHSHCTPSAVPSGTVITVLRYKNSYQYFTPECKVSADDGSI